MLEDDDDDDDTDDGTVHLLLRNMLWKGLFVSLPETEAMIGLLYTCAIARSENWEAE